MLRSKHVRYGIDLADHSMARFERLGVPSPWRPVLIADESHAGCRVITIGRPEEVDVGETIQIVIGKIHSVAKIKRVEMMEAKVLSLGCEYSEYPQIG